MAKSELDKIADKIIAKKEQDSINEIMSISKALNSESERATLPVSIFDAHFKDHFKNGYQEGLNPALTAKWVGVAGSPYKPVDLIGEDGSVVETIPPLMARAKANTKDSGTSKIINNFKMRTARSTADGINYLNANIDKIASSVEVEEVDYKEKIDKITGSKTTTSKKEETVEFDYD